MMSTQLLNRPPVNAAQSKEEWSSLFLTHSLTHSHKHTHHTHSVLLSLLLDVLHFTSDPDALSGFHLLIKLGSNTQ